MVSCSFHDQGTKTVSGDFVAAGILIVAVVMQIIALFRSLRIADDDEIEYGKTVGWFVASVVALFIAVLIAVVVFSGVFDPER